MKKIDSRLNSSLATLIQAMGYEFVGGEWVRQGSQALLRIYIDSLNGITADSCALVSRQVGAMLDVENFVEGHYILEVSSPGVDRPLFTLVDYEKQVGKRIRVRLGVPVEGRRQFTGVIQKVEGEAIHLLTSEQVMLFPVGEIEKANVIGEVRL